MDKSKVPRFLAHPVGTLRGGPGKHSREVPVGRKFLNFFLNGAFTCTLYFGATAGPPNVAGPGLTYTPTVPLLF